MSVDRASRKHIEQDFRRAVLLRDNYQCRLRIDENCSVKATDVHHIIPRMFNFFRYDVKNGLAVCRYCHSRIENDHQLMTTMLLKRVEQDVLIYLNRNFYSLYGRWYIDEEAVK